MLRKGDPCPCCGMPIPTDDPMILKILTDIACGTALRQTTQKQTNN